jgi:tetratricopeptide (TPR) repeat protein
LNANLNSLKDRYYHWVAALGMLKEHLFFGIGIDSFGDYYRLFRLDEAIKLRGTANSGTNNAHNTFIQLGATGGLVLLLAYILFTLFIGYRAIRALKIHKEKTITSGLLSIWIAFQVQSLVSIDQIGLVVWGWASAGCLVALSYPTIDASKSVRKVAKKSKNEFELIHKLVVVTAIIPSMALAPIVFNEGKLRNQIVTMSKSQNLAELRSNGLKVVTIAAKSKGPELRLQAVNYLLQAELTDDALEISKMNNKDFPNSWESWNSTAGIYESIGQKKKAISYRQKSVDLDPLNMGIQKLLEEDKASN